MQKELLNEQIREAEEVETKMEEKKNSNVWG